MREGWKEVTIGDLGQVVTGNTPPKNDPSNYGGDYPFIKPTDMEIGRRYCTNWEENYSDKAFKRYKNSYIPPKSTGVVTIGTVGDKLFQADRWCFTNQSVNVVIPNTELYDEDFIYYLMKINLPKVENANPGTASGRHHVSKSNFCAIKVRVPENKETQKKIASILSGYDDLIENNLKRIKILEEMAQQTYEEWFVRMRFPGYESVKINKETGLPEGWEKVRLGDLWEIQSSKRIYLSDYVDSGIPFFRGKEITQKSENSTISDLLYIKEEKFKGLKEKYGAPSKNDILITAVGTLGNLYMVRETDEDFYFKDGNLIWFKSNEDYSSYYLLYYLKSTSFQNYITNTAIGSSQKALTIKGMKESDIIKPNKDLIHSFDKIITPILKSIENLQNQNQRLREARDILLPRLMMGMIEV